MCWNSPIDRRRRAAILVVCVAIAVGLAGCGSGMLKPKGRIVRNGEPVRDEPGRTLQVTFSVDAGEGQLGPDFFWADIYPDGSFMVPGKGKQRLGIPPGKYRIAVAILDKADHDLLKGRFGQTNSPFVRELTTDREEIVLDIGTGSK